MGRLENDAAPSGETGGQKMRLGGRSTSSVLDLSGRDRVITGTVLVDLSQFDDATATMQCTDRYLLDVLHVVPDGARVVVDIGDRRYVSADAAVWLHEHDHRLLIEIQGTDPKAVARFIRAGRSGDWGAGA